MKLEENKYRNIHLWISYHYGKAIKCEAFSCLNTSPKRFEWALIKGKEYTKNINHFIQLCPSCHRKYDFTENLRKKFIESHVGVPKPWMEKQIIQMNKKGEIIKTFKSISKASAELDISLGGIANALTGISMSSGGFKWKYKDV